MHILLKILPAPSIETVARRATRHLIRRGVAANTISYDSDENTLVIGDRQRLFLANAHAQCVRAWPWQRGRVLRRFLDSLLDTPEEVGLEEAAPRLLPGVRHIGWFDAASSRALPPEATPQDFSKPILRLGEYLAASVFLDSPQSTRVVAEKDAERWGLSWQEIFEKAKANLASRSRQPLCRLADGVYVSEWHDYYDSARLLLDEVLRDVEIEGNPVALVPTWNQLLVTGDGNPSALGAALSVAEKAAEHEGRPACLVPLVRREGAWRTLDLPVGHPCEPELRRLRVLDLIGPYAEQKRLLDRRHESEGLDVFVASFTGVRDKDGGDTRSYCAWTKGVLALLPKTDEVMFGDLDQPKGQQMLGRFSWAVVWHACHELMTPTEHLLPRFRVDAFPTEDQFAAMRANQGTRDRASG